MDTNKLNMAAISIGDFYIDLIQFLIKCEQYVAQNDSPNTIHRASTFIYVERLMEWRVLQRFRMCDSLKQAK